MPIHLNIYSVSHDILKFGDRDRRRRDEDDPPRQKLYLYGEFCCRNRYAHVNDSVRQTLRSRESAVFGA